MINEQLRRTDGQSLQALGDLNPNILSAQSLETIGDLERHLYYSPEQSRSLIEFHRRLGVTDSYLNFVGKGEPLLLEIPLGKGLTLRVGNIGAFSAEQIARTIQEQTITYVTRGTMGKGFPKTDPDSAAELLSIMIGGHSPDRLYVIFEKENDQGDINPVAGVQAYFSANNVGLIDTLHDSSGRVKSTLSTFQALHLKYPNGPTTNRFFDKYGSVNESETVCMSRLYRQDKKTAGMLNLDDKELGNKAMAALAVGIVIHALKNSDRMPMPQLAIYDTDNSIQDNLNKTFQMQKISEPGNAEATAAVMDTVLKHHYTSEDQGGFIEKIIAGYALFPNYCIEALAYLRRQGIEIDLPKLNEYLQRQLDVSSPALEEQVIFPRIRRPESSIPQSIKPNIIDHHIIEGMRDLAELVGSHQLVEGKGFFLTPYDVGRDEIIELAHSLKATPTTKAEVIEHSLDKIYALWQEKIELAGISVAEVRSLLESGTWAQDLATLSKMLGKYSDPNIIEKESRYVWYPSMNKLAKCIGEEALDLLRNSRMLGIVPFETLESLAKTPIISAGTSAVAETLFTLAATGAKHLTFYDRGPVKGQNLSRLPGGMASILNMGTPKALALIDQLYLVNPYGNFEGLSGKVVNDNSQAGPNDITFDQFFERRGIHLEVIDDLQGKARMRMLFPDQEIVYAADTTVPFAGIEKGTPFNQDGKIDLIHMTSPLSQEQPSLDATGRLFTMLGKDLPVEHKWPLLLWGMGEIPFWSQPGMGAHELAALTTRLLLAYLSGENVTGVNYTAQTIPPLGPRYTPAQQETINKLAA